MTNWIRAAFDADEAHAWPLDGSTERLAVVGWWCDRGSYNGHFTMTAERTGNAPILVPVEAADEVRALLAQYSDTEED